MRRFLEALVEVVGFLILAEAVAFAVLWPLERNEDTGGPLWVPSITFDRLKNDADSTKETSSLVFRMGWEWQGGDSANLDGWYARTNLAYATDFDFKSVQVAGEAEFQPVVSSWGIDNYKKLGLGFEARWRPLLRMETGYVFDDGGRAGLKDDELFLRMGGRLSAELRHGATSLRDWTLRLDATLLEGLAGEPDENEMYEVRARRQLDKEGHLNLELGWRKGETLLVQDDVQTLTFGLSLKY